MSVLKNLFSKKMRLITIVLIVAIGLGVVAVLGGKIFTDASTTTFSKEGSVVIANAQAESNTYSFVSGTKYSKKFNGNYKFKDSQGKEVELEKENFLFYKDSTYASLTKGVALNTDDLQENKYVNYYSIPELLEVEQTSKGYMIKANEDTLQFSEMIWKISDDKYMLLGSNIQAKFSDDDIREVKGFVEFNYIDDGVVQIVTQDNVWQTVSKDAQLVTGNGTSVHLVDQYVEHNGYKMLLSKMVIDSDANIELSPLETKKSEIPDFNVNSTSGDDGSSGNNGNNGNSGNKATNGYSGVNGNLGNDGDDGTDADDGNDGEDGTDSTTQSTFTTQIPTVQITDWDVSATGFSGVYVVKDQNDMMDGNLTLKLYEQGTGREIDCIDNNGLSNDFGSTADIDVKFKNGDTLKPDTEYQLSISGSYKMDGVAASREFVVKTFYTDSLGVIIEKDSAETDKLGIKVSKKDYAAGDISVNLYLLNPDQAAKDFNPNDSSYAVRPYTFGKDEKSKVLEFSKEELIKLIQNSANDAKVSNTVYTARIVVSMKVNGQEQKYISQQVLKLMTLKKAPEVGVPSAISNRSSWGFELYGGTIKDEDNAITSYVYKIYRKLDDGTSKWVRDINVDPAKSKSATMLYIDGQTIRAGEVYYLQVVTKYNDNEKDVEVTSPISNTFTLVGSQLPAVSFNYNGYKQDTSAIQGTLHVSANGSKINLSDLSTYPVYVDVMCEGIYERKIAVTDQMIRKTPDQSSSDDSFDIILDLLGLNNDKIYRLDVSAWVDVSDNPGQNYSFTNIGHVAVSTRDFIKLRANFTTQNSDNSEENTTNSFSRWLSFTSAETGKTLDKTTTDANDLSEVIVQLYNSETNTLIAEHVFDDNDAQLRSSSLTEMFINKSTEITEETFGRDASSIPDRVYLKVAGVYDYTKTLSDNNYNHLYNYTYEGKTYDANVSHFVNSYTVTNAQSEEISKTVQPPTLPSENLNSQITALPIRNNESSQYGKSKDANLPDDAIVGYTIDFAYANNARLARNVELYAFESGTFDGTSNKMGLIYDSDNGTLKTSGGPIKYHGSFSVSKASFTLPKIAILFGNGNATSANGRSVVYTNSLSRGYKYTFAYGVYYADKATDDNGSNVYPYQMPTFTSVDNKNSYILSSSTCNTPRVAPTVYSYLKNSKNTGNKAELNYYYMDPDGAFGGTSTKLNNSDITLPTIPDGKNVSDWSDLVIDVPNQNVSEKKTLSFEYSEYVDTKEPKSTTESHYYYNSKTVDTNTWGNMGIKVDKTGMETTNIFKITLNMDSIADKNAILDNVAGIRYTFSVADTSVTPVSIYKSFTDATDLTASINLSRLSKLVNKGPISIKAEILYETGRTGWNYMSNGDPFAMANDDKYLSVGTTQVIENKNTVSGSMYTVNSTSINNFVDFKSEPNKSCSIALYSTVAQSTTNYTLTTTTDGINMTDTNSNSYNAIPAELGEYTVRHTESLDEIKTIIPSAAAGTYEAQINSVIFSSLYIYGYDQISGNDKEINIHLYDKDPRTNADAKVVKTIPYTLSTNGNTGSDKDTVFLFRDLEISGLDINKTYYMTISAKVGTNGEEKQLINTGTVETNNRFVRQISTLSKIEVNEPTVTVKRNSYTNRYLDINYKLSQTSNIKMLYTICDKDGNPIEGLIDLSGSVSPNSYQRNMNDNVNINDYLGSGTDKKLKYGESYKLKIQAYELKDGKLSKNDDGTYVSASDPIEIDFDVPTPSDPIPVTYIWATEGTNSEKFNLHFNFAINDKDKIIKTDSNENAYFYVKVFKVTKKDGNDKIDDVSNQLTDDDGGKLVNSDDTPRAFTVGTNYSYILENVDVSATYRMELYTSIDKDNDGKTDGLPDDLADKSLTELTNEEFKQVEATLSYTSKQFTTPSTSGIAFGQTDVNMSSDDNTKVRVTFRGAVGLNTIDRVSYTIVDTENPNKAYSGDMDNNYKDTDPLFVQRANGYFTLDLDSVLPDKGHYQVTVRFYIKNAGTNEYTEINASEISGDVVR